jgi:RNA polymerase sigma factor (sigma-70 family)
MDMAANQMSGFIQHLRSVLRDGAGLTDGQLLGDYLSRRDEAAIAALVRRHGPMVWGVCRRVLHNHHDAEDAFQTTFLVLVRKASSIASRELLANWLYGVAHQTALKARATAAKRKGRERQATEMPEPAITQQDPWRDLQPLLDEELSRLPDKYRSVVVLCDLEGKTRKEAARQLGCPEGTVAGRLARARIMLAKRLTRRGVVLSCGALAAVLAQQASAGVPASVVVSTIKAASLLAAGKAAATGAISVKVAALTEGVMKAMLFTKLKAVLAVVLIFGFLATGATVLTCRTAAGQEDKPAIAEKPVKASPKQEQEQDKEDFTAWGKEAGGLQAGLGYRPGEHRAYHHGETVALVVRVRNVSKEQVKFQYVPQFLMEKLPAVTDGEDKPIHLGGVTRFGFHKPVEMNLAPGKEIELYELKLELRPASESGKAMFSTLYGTGKFHIQYERVFGNSSSGTITLDPALSKLATGKLELEIKPEAAPKDDNEANKPVNPRVSTDKEKATVEGQLDEASTLVLRIGEEKDKLFWEARRKDTPGSAMVRFSEEGAKRFWGDKAQSAGAFKAVVELSDKILMSDGKFATGFIYSVAISEGAATEKQSLIGSIVYVPIPKTGTVRDLLARSLAGDAMPFGQLSLREESKIVRKDGVITFADIQKGDGKLVPVSFVIKKTGQEDKPPVAEKPVEAAAKQTKPLKLRVYIEKVNAEAQTITASCMLLGEIDNVTKPLRFENLRVSENAMLMEGGKEIKFKLTDLKLDAGYFLYLKTYEDELGFEVAGIEKIGIGK